MYTDEHDIIGQHFYFQILLFSDLFDFDTCSYLQEWLKVVRQM